MTALRLRWAHLKAWLRERQAPVEPEVIRPRPVPLPFADDDGPDDGSTRLDIRISRPYVERPRTKRGLW